MIKNKLQPIVENILQEEQCGFRKGRSCVDAIFTIKQIMEKRIEFNLPTYLLFLDYVKAYDKVNRSKLWNIMSEYQIPSSLLNAIKSLYDQTEIKIRMQNTKTPNMNIRVNLGLRQGCGLSPLLFDIYMNKILEEWKSLEPRGIYLGKNKEIKTILFADDQVLMTSNEDDLQYNVMKLNSILKEYNMEISCNKTKVLAMEGKSMRRAKIVIDGQNIEQVRTFKYLGCSITNYQVNLDLEENLQRYNQTNGIIKKNTLVEICRKMYRSDSIISYLSLHCYMVVRHGS